MLKDGRLVNLQVICNYCSYDIKGRRRILFLSQSYEYVSGYGSIAGKYGRYFTKKNPTKAELRHTYSRMSVSADSSVSAHILTFVHLQ